MSRTEEIYAHASVRECMNANESFKKCMPCTDDSHPLSLLDKKAVAMSVCGVLFCSFTINKWVEHADCMVTFGAGSVVVYMAYYVLDSVLVHYSEKYKSINNKDKQFYVLSNTIKCFMLASFTPFCVQVKKNRK
eukprot:comp19825_c0_seq2/m.23849 comp19825_c0_seq2/g.23849  ORF comp19825_c0_seq2/g.23849 comp19825_c0_seq2/m.23849 type:complete len:134 (-) comp19825_c0_seq2:158-559(-)